MINSDFIWPVRVYYEDTDAGGVVYHANYLKFFERARTEMLRALGCEQDTLRTTLGILFVVRAMDIDFIRSARFNELLETRTQIIELKKASLTFSQHLTLGDAVLCQSNVRVACLDANTMRPKAIPENLLELLKNEH